MSKEGCGIYTIINRVNCKMYVGSSKCLHKRRVNHFNSLRRGDHRNCYLQSSWNKYGEENFEWKILEFCKEKELLKREYYYIQHYNTSNENCGYNLCLNPSRPSMSEETKVKLSKSRKGIKFSEEHLRNLSLSHKGVKPSLETRKRMSESQTGKHRNSPSEEVKKKISEKLKGRKLPKEVVEKMKGRKCSEETKLKMSLKRKGKPIPKLRGRVVWNKGLTYKSKPCYEEIKKKTSESNLGKKHTEESKKKISKTLKGRKLSEETRKRMSESAKLGWEKKIALEKMEKNNE